MKANETNLQPLLEGTKQYVIPLFQRVYCWTKKDWSELWRDLLDLYEADSSREHFMGAIVTMPVDMLPQGVSKFLLIDGQQRMTTILIILAIIRDLTRGKSDLADQINELYLINKWGKDMNRPKLLPTTADRDTFSNIIEGKEILDGSIGQSYRFFRRMLSGRDNHGHPIDLRHMHDVMMQQLAFVSVVLGSDDSPYRIFHSLNGTGVPLTQADLVRNHVFMLIPDPDDQQIAYEDLWLPMQEMQGEELTNFMWRYITKDGTLVRQNGIYDAIRARTSSMASGHVIGILEDMHTYAGFYIRLIDPAQEPNPHIRRRLERINRWEINTAYPFLLNVYNDLNAERITADEMSQILDLIESFVIRRFFCRVPTNALNNYFISMYRSLDQRNLVASVSEYLLARHFPNDQEFLDGWERLPIYLSGTAKCRHILETLEDALNTTNEPVDVTSSRITIEHVMPQSLNEAWKTALGSDADNVYAVYLHTVGNLTLTGMNESMGNIPFEEKQQFFARSNFALNDYLANCKVWDESEINKRVQTLGELALNIWGRPEGSETAAQDSDDPTGRKPIGFTLMGRDYETDTWREVLLGACAVLAEYHGDSFAARAVRATGSKRQYVSFSPEGMTNPAQIPGTELWVETNQSARSVLSTISHILAACGHDEDDFDAVWE